MNDGWAVLEQFHFLRPYWLLAVLPALLLFALLWRKDAHAGEWKRAISPQLLPYLIQGQQTRDSKIPMILLLIAWLLASVAMAGPTWQQLPAAMKKKIDARVIVLDLTLSMLASDTPPSRLMRAKHKLSDILGRSKEGLTGLVVFAGTSHVVSPLTDDSNTILSLATSLTPDIMPVRGSDPLAAIKQAAEVLTAAGLPQGQVLFIGDDLPENYAEALEPLKETITLSVLAVGTPEGAPIALGNGRYLKDASGAIVLPTVNHARMREAATRFGGRYSAMSADDSDINLLLADFLNLDDEVRETQREFDIWDDSGAWIALLILPLAAISYRRGWLGVILLPWLLSGALLHSTQARAEGWDALWKNQDQRGKEAFDQQKWDAAAAAFRSPEWKAGALYKGGKYPEAEALYKDQTSADAHYNRGNALAQQGKLEEAVKAYDEALKLDPGMQDAKTNQETVKRFIKKREQSSPQGGEGDSNQQKPGDDQNQQDGQDKQDNQDQKGSQDQQNGQNQKDQQDQKSGQDQQGDQQNGQNGEQQENPEESSSAKKESDDKDKSDKHQNGDPSTEQEEESDQAKNDASPGTETETETEDSQAMEQWLRRVPDDPGGLLRRKFEYESRLRRNNENQNGTPW